MAHPRSPVIIIPARMASTRLPGKPLADIRGEPMIVQVWRRAMAGLGPVVVAARRAGDRRAVDQGRRSRRPDRSRSSLRLRPHLRGAAARRSRRPPRCGGQSAGRSADDRSRRSIRRVLDAARDDGVDIATLAVDDHRRDAERANPNVVKAVVALDAGTAAIGRALYFTRATVPTGEGPLYHHVGIYAYRRAALARFVALPPSPLETAREAGAIARARGRHAHRRGPR